MRIKGAEQNDEDKRLDPRVQRMVDAMDEIGVKAYLSMYKTKSKFRRMLGHFFEGVMRGVGMAVGFSLLGALLLYILQQSFVNNIPFIGKFVSDIVEIVNKDLSRR